MKKIQVTFSLVSKSKSDVQLPPKKGVRNLRRDLAEALGVTEADVKDYGVYYHKAVLWIKLWNWRKLEITDLDLYIWERRYK